MYNFDYYIPENIKCKKILDKNSIFYDFLCLKSGFFADDADAVVIERSGNKFEKCTCCKDQQRRVKIKQNTYDHTGKSCNQIQKEKSDSAECSDNFGRNNIVVDERNGIRFHILHNVPE